MDLFTLGEAGIKTITRAFGDFTAVDARPLACPSKAGRSGDKPAEPKSSRGRPAATPKTEPVKTFAAKIFRTTNLPRETEVTFLPMEAIGEQGSLDTSRTKKSASPCVGATS